MRFGLLIPISNGAIAFAFITAVIVTIILFIYHLVSGANKKIEESTFNLSYQKADQSCVANPENLSHLLSRMPLRRANIDAGTVLFWTNDGPLALAVGRANQQSPFKVFLRTDRSASELGHKIVISDSHAHNVTLKITAESLIFSDSESTLYDVDLYSLNELTTLLKGNSCSINDKIEIPIDCASAIIGWASHMQYFKTHSQDKLLIGE